MRDEIIVRCGTWMIIRLIDNDMNCNDHMFLLLGQRLGMSAIQRYTSCVPDIVTTHKAIL